MGFTTPCFIRKNTPDLRKKLEELGYNHPTDVVEDERFCIATSPVNCNYHIIIKGAFDDTNPYYTWNCAGRIDCGTNEELFLAIAALRDDTDKNQWLVLDHDNIWEAVGCYQYKGDFILCNHDRWYCGTDVAQAYCKGIAGTILPKDSSSSNRVEYK